MSLLNPPSTSLISPKLSERLGSISGSKGRIYNPPEGRLVSKCNSIFSATTPEINWQSVERLVLQLFSLGIHMMKHMHMLRKVQKWTVVHLYFLLIIPMSSWVRERLEWKLCGKCTVQKDKRRGDMGYLGNDERVCHGDSLVGIEVVYGRGMVGIVEEGLENGTGGVTVGTCNGELGVGEMLGRGGEDVLGKDGEDMLGKVGSSKRVCCVMSWTKGNLFERSKIRKGGGYVVSHAIFVPVGGGGLTAGIAAYVERVSQQVKIIGVEPTDADGVAVKEVGEETFRLCKELVDGVVLVSRDSICASIKDMFEEKRSILEPAGALALAGAEAYGKYYGLKGGNVVAITSGANMNFDNLRVVTELANVGRKQEAVLATVMPEEPGSFKQFCQLVGQMNITEFKYRFNSNDKAVVLYSVEVHSLRTKSNAGEDGIFSA